MRATLTIHRNKVQKHCTICKININISQYEYILLCAETVVIPTQEVYITDIPPRSFAILN